MPHNEFAAKYNRQIRCVADDYERTFVISCVPKDAPNFEEMGSFVLSRGTHFNHLMTYARYFPGHRAADVVDDLLLLQVECRVFEKVVW